MWRAGLLLAIVGAACATRPAAETGQLRRENARLRREVAELRRQLDTSDVRYRSLGRVIPIFLRRPIEARVLEVQGDEVTLTLSAGYVQLGDVLHLGRGSDYVGAAEVASIEGETVVATIDREFPGKAFPPRPNDVAYAAEPR